MNDNRREPPELQGLASRIREAIQQWSLQRSMTRGYSAFARAAGIPPTTLHQYVRDEDPSEPGALHLARIARTARVSADWLLYGSGEGPSLGPDTPRRAVLRIFTGLRKAAIEMGLQREYKNRLLDRIKFIEHTVLRNIFDVELAMREIQAMALRQKFDVEEFRRDWDESDENENTQ